MSEQQSKTGIVDAAAILLATVKNYAEWGIVQLAPVQGGFIDAAEARLEELRGAGAEQQLADLCAIFALKLTRVEATAHEH